MNTTSTACVFLECESCGDDAEVRVAYPDTTFLLCLRCVPAELRAVAEPLPGLEGLVEDLVGILDEIHPASSAAHAAGRV